MKNYKMYSPFCWANDSAIYFSCLSLRQLQAYLVKTFTLRFCLTKFCAYELMFVARLEFLFSVC